MTDELPPGIGETAVGAAMMRARETSRRDGLFTDPYAQAFVSAVPPIFESGPTVDDDPALAELETAFEQAVVIRTRFFDDFATASASGGCQQIVLVGAGLDTRAFRLDWPVGLRLYELDLPEVLAFKQAVLAGHQAEPRCNRVTVGVDLQGDWPTTLVTAGFDQGLRSAWIAEGVVPYLPADRAERLLDAIGRLSFPGSRLAMDQPNLRGDSLLATASAMPSMDQITSMWKGGLVEDAASWLATRGWQPEAIQVAELEERYNRRGISSSTDRYVAATRLG
jgi:methyltransferase (TIGR00027 family)